MSREELCDKLICGELFISLQNCLMESNFNGEIELRDFE
jgi:hypothetical protein